MLLGLENEVPLDFVAFPLADDYHVQVVMTWRPSHPTAEVLDLRLYTSEGPVESWQGSSPLVVNFTIEPGIVYYLSPDVEPGNGVLVNQQVDLRVEGWVRRPPR